MHPSASTFVGEAEACALLASAGWRPPRHALLEGDDPAAVAALPFAPGEPVVVKGLGENLWHKSELGAVAFLDFDTAAVVAAVAGMRARVTAAGHRWLGALVAERIAVARAPGGLSEALLSLVHTDAGWLALLGPGGLQAEAWSATVPLLRWPLAWTTPAAAQTELQAHLLGRTWLGRLRGGAAVTSPRQLAGLVEGLWSLAAAAERAGLTLLELNPVAFDERGDPRPLDAVGRRDPRPAPAAPPPAGWWDVLRAPRRVALAGVAASGDGLGCTILANVRRCPVLSTPGDPPPLVIVKPGLSALFGLPCVPDVAALRNAPVDLLLLAVPAPAAAAMVEQLIAQGGGARVVGLVPGGLGDGADRDGLGARLAATVQAARADGRWTPALLGPNFLGHWAPPAGLNTTFIAEERLAFPPPVPDAGEPGLVLLGQSGAFLLCRRARAPHLPVRLALALGNQLDVSIADALTASANDPGCTAVVAYVEGFPRGGLGRAAAAVALLRERGAPVVVLRSGRGESGHAAAATHTGALLGDPAIERSVLERAGARWCESVADLDAAVAWLGASPPARRGGPLAVVTNAGFETVTAADVVDAAGGVLRFARLDEAAQARLVALLEAEELTGLVAPRVPLDLTPMARETAFVGAVETLLAGEAAGLVVGLVPFTERLDVAPAGAARLAAALAAVARQAGKPVGVVADAGERGRDYREAFAAAGLAVFERMEDAVRGWRVL